MSEVAIVTGGSGALGSAVASELVARGSAVALIDAPPHRERTEALARGLGDRVRAFAGDVGDAASWLELLPAIERELGPVTQAVLTAGGWRGGVALHAEPDDASYRLMMESNAGTVQQSLRALLPGMVARARGSIVVIGSRNVERPWAGATAAAYTASKAAVVALAQAVAAEVLPHGVRVNAVLPSTLDTPANRRAMPDADPTRWVGTASASKVIAFLLSEDARDVSGAALPVYGRA